MRVPAATNVFASSKTRIGLEVIIGGQRGHRVKPRLPHVAVQLVFENPVVGALPNRRDRPIVDTALDGCS